MYRCKLSRYLQNNLNASKRPPKGSLANWNPWEARYPCRNANPSHSKTATHQVKHCVEIFCQRNLNWKPRLMEGGGNRICEGMAALARLLLCSTVTQATTLKKIGRYTVLTVEWTKKALNVMLRKGRTAQMFRNGTLGGRLPADNRDRLWYLLPLV